jgi:hypothetical protein
VELNISTVTVYQNKDSNLRNRTPPYMWQQVTAYSIQKCQVTCGIQKYIWGTYF